MTATTPAFVLPYPTGGDRPCDGHQQINALSDAIFDALDGFQKMIDWQTSPPMVSVTWEGAIQHIDGQAVNVIFNSVERDNVQAGNLIALNDGITLGVSPEYYGFYLYGFTVRATNGSWPGWETTVSPNTWGAIAYDYHVNASGTGTEGWSVSPEPTWGASALLPVTSPTTIKLTSGTGSSAIDVYFARLWAVRIGGI